MPWKESCAMSEKKLFVSDWLKKAWSMSDLCHYYQISRKTGYKWIERYKKEGLGGLNDVKRAPNTHPNQTPANMEEEIIQFRTKHRYWGPRKLVNQLGIKDPTVNWPSASTVGNILKRNGLIVPRRRYRRSPLFKGPRNNGVKPNDVWAADFKGWFQTGDGVRLDPLTISDWSSRYLILCHGLRTTATTFVKEKFEHVFREFGLPQAIRTDNGPPFASRGVGGLSRLSVWWVRLGIMPERIRPGHPEENGRHERMHRTLKQQTAKPPKATESLQQDAFDDFGHEYNDVRPHEALGMKTPSACYEPAKRPFPRKLPQVSYKSEFRVWRVRSDGTIKWDGKRYYLGESVACEYVGLKEVNNDIWDIYFGPIYLATFDAIQHRLNRPSWNQFKRNLLPMCPV